MSVDARFNLIEIDPDTVVVNPRLVALREEHVLDLAGHIERSRYVQPILVVRLTDPVGSGLYRLIAGRHRTEACRLLGWPVPALVVDESAVADGEEQLLEALENAGRLVLTHAQKVQHEQVILRYYAERLGRPLSREERVERIEEAAKRNGIAKRTAQLLVQRAEELSPEILDAVKGTKLDTVQGLDLLASMRDDAARLNRIEREQRREARRPRQQEASRQAAGWIREILDRGLGAGEIARIAQILPLTTVKHLQDALNGDFTPSQEAAPDDPIA